MAYSHARHGRKWHGIDRHRRVDPGDVSLALEALSNPEVAQLERQARFATRLRTARTRAGITQRNAASSAGVTELSWRRWEQGLRAPKLWRVEKIASALGCTLAELLVDEPAGACVAEVWISAQTIRDVRSGGRAHALEVAERIGRGLEPLVWQAATGRLPRAQDTPARSKPRRSRAQVLAGLSAAQEASTRARLSYMEGALQRIEADRHAEGAGGGDD